MARLASIRIKRRIGQLKRLGEKLAPFFNRFWEKLNHRKSITFLFFISGLFLYFYWSQESMFGFLLGLVLLVVLAVILTQKIADFLKRFHWFWWVAWILAQIYLIILLTNSFVVDSSFLIALITSFLIILFAVQLFDFFILFGAWVVKELIRYRFFKFLLVRFPLLLVVLGLGFLARQNNALTQRVGHLEEVIGTNRLLCSEKKSVEKVEKSLVRIIGRGVEGTGFFIDKKGSLLTNHHVVAGDLHPKIIFPDYSLAQGEVIAANKDFDLAIVKVEMGRRKIPALEFGDVDTLQAFDELIALGYALGTTVRGKATTNKGHFVALRPGNELEINLVQSNIEIAHGMSGGPMIDLCGKVMGINSMSTDGISLALSGNDFVNQKWGEMVNQEDPVAEIERIEFKPNESPKSCVEAFYNYQTVGDLESAYNLLSDNYLNESYQEWKEGYKDTLYVVLVLVEEDEEEEDLVKVRFYAADLRGDELVTKYFEGKQRVVEVDGNYRLDEAEIEEIERPGWGWFWGF